MPRSPQKPAASRSQKPARPPSPIGKTAASGAATSRVNQSRAGQVQANQVQAGQVQASPSRTGKPRADQPRTSQSRATQSRTGLGDLTAVVAVAQHRSFRQAAIELGLSPSALSHVVAGLEQRLGVRLFNRTTRSVALTEAGAHFLGRLRPALAEIAAAMETVNDFRTTPTGTLRLNGSEGAVRPLLQPVILEFLRRYPDMQIDLVTEGRLVDIVAEGFDAGIRGAETVPQDMIAVPCSPPTRFAVVGSPGYFARHRKPKTPGDLAQHTCIRRRMPSGTLFPWQFDKQAQSLTIDVKGPLILNNSALMIEAALAGAGLAWVSEWDIVEHLKSRRLIRVLEDWTPPYASLCLYYPGHRHVPAGLRAFIDLIKEVMGRRRR